VLEEETEPERDELARYPAVRRLKTALSEDHSGVEFEESLEELLNRIAVMVSNKTP
jgi:TetR/AcrR family tetracycline transcriptional repressor